MEVFHCGLKKLLGARIRGLIERPESGLSDIGGDGVGGNRGHHGEAVFVHRTLVRTLASTHGDVKMFDRRVLRFWSCVAFGF
jgi:hypothetical protein